MKRQLYILVFTLLASAPLLLAQSSFSAIGISTDVNPRLRAWPSSLRFNRLFDNAKLSFRYQSASAWSLELQGGFASSRTTLLSPDGELFLGRLNQQNLSATLLFPFDKNEGKIKTFYGLGADLGLRQFNPDLASTNLTWNRSSYGVHFTLGARYHIPSTPLEIELRNTSRLRGVPVLFNDYSLRYQLLNPEMAIRLRLGGSSKRRRSN